MQGTVRISDDINNIKCNSQTNECNSGCLEK